MVRNPTHDRRDELTGRSPTTWVWATRSIRRRSASSSVKPAAEGRVRRPVLRRCRARRVRGCIECGECMTGCRHGAKNTLVKNYLYLAERPVRPSIRERTVTAVRPRARRRLPGVARRTGGWRGRIDRRDVHGRPRRLLRGHVGYPATAAPDEGRRVRCPALRPARCAHPHELRVDPRGRRRTVDPRLDCRTAWRSPPSRSTRRATPTSNRCATARGPRSMALAADAADRRGWTRRW